MAERRKKQIAVGEIHLTKDIVVAPGQPFMCPADEYDNLRAQGVCKDPPKPRDNSEVVEVPPEEPPPAA